MKIYLVIGYRGKHDDYREWIVCAHRDKLEAEDHVKQLNIIHGGMSKYLVESTTLY